MPTPNVMPVSKVAEKWARRVSGASQDYVDGAKSAGGRWQAGAAASDANWKAGLAEAQGKGRFVKGIQAAGAAKYTAGIEAKGAMRYGPGAAAGEGDFSRAMAPVLDVMSRTDLPPRGPRGSEGNYQRAAAIGKALRTFATSR